MKWILFDNCFFLFQTKHHECAVNCCVFIYIPVILSIHAIYHFQNKIANGYRNTYCKCVNYAIHIRVEHVHGSFLLLCVEMQEQGLQQRALHICTIVL